jgi:cytochrome c-type biogenesis protein CcmH/NrfG
MVGDIQQEILDELRNQTAMVRKMNKINIIVLSIILVVIAISIALIPFKQRILYGSKVSSQRADSGQEARDLLDGGEYQRAQEMLQRLINKHPDYYYGYVLLGSLHQELSSMKEAEANYAKAYNLFPTEENKKTLTAIRAVLKKNKAASK